MPNSAIIDKDFWYHSQNKQHLPNLSKKKDNTTDNNMQTFVSHDIVQTSSRSNDNMWSEHNSLTSTVPGRSSFELGKNTIYTAVHRSTSSPLKSAAEYNPRIKNNDSKHKLKVRFSLELVRDPHNKNMNSDTYIPILHKSKASKHRDEYNELSETKFDNIATVNVHKVRSNSDKMHYTTRYPEKKYDVPIKKQPEKPQLQQIQHISNGCWKEDYTTNRGSQLIRNNPHTFKIDKEIQKEYIMKPTKLKKCTSNKSKFNNIQKCEVFQDVGVIDRQRTISNAVFLCQKCGYTNKRFKNVGVMVKSTLEIKKEYLAHCNLCGHINENNQQKDLSLMAKINENNYEYDHNCEVCGHKTYKVIKTKTPTKLGYIPDEILKEIEIKNLFYAHEADAAAKMSSVFQVKTKSDKPQNQSKLQCEWCGHAVKICKDVGTISLRTPVSKYDCETQCNLFYQGSSKQNPKYDMNTMIIGTPEMLQCDIQSKSKSNKKIGKTNEHVTLKTSNSNFAGKLSYIFNSGTGLCKRMTWSEVSFKKRKLKENKMSSQKSCSENDMKYSEVMGISKVESSLNRNIYLNNEVEKIYKNNQYNICNSSKPKKYSSRNISANHCNISSDHYSVPRHSCKDKSYKNKRELGFEKIKSQKHSDYIQTNYNNDINSNNNNSLIWRYIKDGFKNVIQLLGDVDRKLRCGCDTKYNPEDKHACAGYNKSMYCGCTNNGYKKYNRNGVSFHIGDPSGISHVMSQKTVQCNKVIKNKRQQTSLYRVEHLEKCTSIESDICQVVPKYNKTKLKYIWNSVKNIIKTKPDYQCECEICHDTNICRTCPYKRPVGLDLKIKGYDEVYNDFPWNRRYCTYYVNETELDKSHMTNKSNYDLQKEQSVSIIYANHNKLLTKNVDEHSYHSSQHNVQREFDDRNAYFVRNSFENDIFMPSPISEMVYDKSEVPKDMIAFNQYLMRPLEYPSSRLKEIKPPYNKKKYKPAETRSIKNNSQNTKLNSRKKDCKQKRQVVKPLRVKTNLNSNDNTYRKKITWKYGNYGQIKKIVLRYCGNGYSKSKYNHHVKTQKPVVSGTQKKKAMNARHSSQSKNKNVKLKENLINQKLLRNNNDIIVQYCTTNNQNTRNLFPSSCRKTPEKNLTVKKHKTRNVNIQSHRSKCRKIQSEIYNPPKSRKTQCYGTGTRLHKSYQCCSKDINGSFGAPQYRWFSKKYSSNHVTINQPSCTNSIIKNQGIAFKYKAGLGKRSLPLINQSNNDKNKSKLNTSTSCGIISKTRPRNNFSDNTKTNSALNMHQTFQSNTPRDSCKACLQCKCKPSDPILCKKCLSCKICKICRQPKSKPKPKRNDLLCKNCKPSHPCKECKASGMWKECKKSKKINVKPMDLCKKTQSCPFSSSIHEVSNPRKPFDDCKKTQTRQVCTSTQAVSDPGKKCKPSCLCKSCVVSQCKDCKPRKPCRVCKAYKTCKMDEQSQEATPPSKLEKICSLLKPSKERTPFTIYTPMDICKKSTNQCEITKRMKSSKPCPVSTSKQRNSSPSKKRKPIRSCKMCGVCLCKNCKPYLPCTKSKANKTCNMSQEVTPSSKLDKKCSLPKPSKERTRFTIRKPADLCMTAKSDHVSTSAKKVINPCRKCKSCQSRIMCKCLPRRSSSPLLPRSSCPKTQKKSKPKKSFCDYFDYDCDRMFIKTIAKKPCVWIYKLWPSIYPYFIMCLHALKQTYHCSLLCLACLSWLPCFFCMQICINFICQFCCN